MCEADLFQADQVVIFKGDFACLQGINLTNSTTGDLVFMDGKKFYLTVEHPIAHSLTMFNPFKYACKQLHDVWKSGKKWKDS